MNICDKTKVSLCIHEDQRRLFSELVDYVAAEGRHTYRVIYYSDVSSVVLDSSVYHVFAGRIPMSVATSIVSNPTMRNIATGIYVSVNQTYVDVDMHVVDLPALTNRQCRVNQAAYKYSHAVLNFDICPRISAYCAVHTNGVNIFDDDDMHLVSQAEHVIVPDNTWLAELYRQRGFSVGTMTETPTVRLEDEIRAIRQQSLEVFRVFENNLTERMMTYIESVRDSKLILSMIVKNEASVIVRCLESVYRHIDGWCISDTGSTDGTQEIIRNFFKSKNIPGKLIQNPWVDFATNRQYALDAIDDPANAYAFVIDADEVLELKTNLKPYRYTHMVQVDTYTSSKARIFKVNECMWQYPIHEVIISKYQSYLVYSQLGIEQCLITRHTDGDRAKNPDRFRQDAMILSDCIGERENGRLINGHALLLDRLYFYRANSYSILGVYTEAIRSYKKCINAKSGYDIEVYVSHYYIAMNMLAAKEPLDECVDAFYTAFKLEPGRIEPLYQIARAFYVNGYLDKAREFINILSAATLPEHKFFTDQTLYTVHIPNLVRLLTNPTAIERIDSTITSTNAVQNIQQLDLAMVENISTVDVVRCLFQYLQAYITLKDRKNAYKYYKLIHNHAPREHWPCDEQFMADVFITYLT